MSETAATLLIVASALAVLWWMQDRSRLRDRAETAEWLLTEERQHRHMLTLGQPVRSMMRVIEADGTAGSWLPALPAGCEEPTDIIATPQAITAGQGTDSPLSEPRPEWLDEPWTRDYFGGRDLDFTGQLAALVEASQP